MRTGTHYFPRGVNAVAAVERSRQKFGLNKIDETVGETMCTTSITNVTSNSVISNHRRTESCDLSQRRQSASNILSNSNAVSNCNGSSTAPIVSKEVSNLMQANTHSRMSPDLQRHLGYQSYRGFECKSINIVLSCKNDGHHNNSILLNSFGVLCFFFRLVCAEQLHRHGNGAGLRQIHGFQHLKRPQWGMATRLSRKWISIQAQHRRELSQAAMPAPMTKKGFPSHTFHSPFSRAN